MRSSLHDICLLEIPLPNEQARLDILKIHAAPITKMGEIGKQLQNCYVHWSGVGEKWMVKLSHLILSLVIVLLLALLAYTCTCALWPKAVCGHGVVRHSCCERCPLSLSLFARHSSYDLLLYIYSRYKSVCPSLVWWVTGQHNDSFLMCPIVQEQQQHIGHSILAVVGVNVPTISFDAGPTYCRANIPPFNTKI